MSRLFLEEEVEFDRLRELACFVRDHEEMLLRLIALAKAAPQQVRQSAEEPESHRFARELLGPNFHGLGAVEKHFGLTAEERASLLPLQLRDHHTGQLLTEEQTLQLVERYKDTHVLVAVKPGLSLVGFHAAHKDAFGNDRSAPWFGQPNQRTKWSDTVAQDPWLLVRKDVVAGSTGKDIDGQSAHLVGKYPNERFLSPAEYCYAATLHQWETGEKICPNHIVRFPVRAAEGYWVNVDWYGGRLGVDRWGGGAYGDVGSCSARTS